MIAQDEFDLALENLRETYSALALATPATTVRRTGNVVVAEGDLAHPICNFVLLDRTEPEDPSGVRQLATERPCVNVYQPVPGERASDRRFRIAGLERVHSLEVMVAPGRVLGDAGRIALGEAERPSDRDGIAAFMADQFFGRYRAAMRTGIARSTAEARSLRLFATPDLARPSAAVLLTETGGALGLYNLCVRPEERGRGLGAEVVRWVLAAAHARGECVTLQCDDRLAGWYRRFGFATVGRLVVFSAPR